jgi:CheY-like chemotaxis protein
MPGMSGIESTKKIRDFLSLEMCILPELQPKIIGVTGHVLTIYSKQGFAAGMDEIISKPLYVDVLKKVMDRYS